MDERTAYLTVGRYLETLLEPYVRLHNVAMVWEVAALILAIVAVVTLHSMRKTLHLIGAFGAPAAAFASLTMQVYCSVATGEALTRLPDMVCSDYPQPQCSRMIEVAAQVENQFNAAAGFWGSAEYQSANTLLTVTCLALLIGAALTTRVVSVWQPSYLPVSSMPVAEAIRPTIGAPLVAATIPRKFCQFCGLAIVHDSKYCEECGKRLVL
jgi:hypothetical protein